MKVYEYGCWTERLELGRDSEWHFGHLSTAVTDKWWGFALWKNGCCVFSQDGYGSWGSYTAEEYGADLEDFLLRA